MLVKHIAYLSSHLTVIRIEVKDIFERCSQVVSWIEVEVFDNIDELPIL